ncbi:MAG: hypothetical protein AB7O29_11805 [Acidimicrobiia bacterium]
MSFAIGLVLLVLAGGWLFVLVDGEDGRDAHHRVADVADGRWRGVRTDAAGRVLVVSLLAEPSYRADDQCSVDYRLRLREFADRVEITVLERAAREKSRRTVSCPDVGHGRLVRGELVAPLAGRRLVGQPGDIRRPVVAGSDLLTRGWLPPDWEIESERAQESEGATPAWVRWWATSRPVDRLLPGCDRDDVGLGLVEGPPSVLSPRRYLGEEPVGERSVRGFASTISTSGDGQSSSLWWREGGMDRVLRLRTACPLDLDIRVDLLLRVGRSLG